MPANRGFVLRRDIYHRDISARKFDRLYGSVNMPRHTAPHPGKIHFPPDHSAAIIGNPLPIVGIESRYRITVMCIPGIGEGFDQRPHIAVRG